MEEVVGLVLGVAEGVSEGEELGCSEGEALGDFEGLSDGADDGEAEGLLEGCELGGDDGKEVGEEVGLAVGSGVGDADGSELGLALSVGVALGLDDGARDGASVTGAASMKNHAHSLAVSVLPSAKISHRASSVPAPSRNRTTSWCRSLPPSASSTILRRGSLLGLPALGQARYHVPPATPTLRMARFWGYSAMHRVLAVGNLR